MRLSWPRSQLWRASLLLALLEAGGFGGSPGLSGAKGPENSKLPAHLGQTTREEVYASYLNPRSNKDYGLWSSVPFVTFSPNMTQA